jgi:flap endonuclease-1
MGIKYLNRYLQSKCKKNAIQRVSLQSLSGKTIVIDTYIYIYKFLGEETLIESMNKMVSMFMKYKITPIFVFDGKPPQEKRTLLQMRREKKQEAEEKYKEILQQIESGIDMSDNISSQLACLKKQFLKIDQEHIQCVKTILRQYHVEIVDAAGESDELCVQYVKNRRAWACLTNDMDMFVYGVERVLRELSLNNHTCDLYVMQHILQDLNMDMKTFRQIMVLSGTDYNVNTNVSLHETLKWYYDYKRYYTKHQGRCLDFYEWLLKYTKYIQDYSKLKQVYKLFDV